MKLKHKVQDLIDDGFIYVGAPNNSCNEDTSLEKDHVDKPMSSDGFLDALTSSNAHVSTKTSIISNMPPSMKEPNDFHTMCTLKGYL